MAFLALDRDPKASPGLGAQHHADGRLRSLQDRALFDVGLQISRHRAVMRRLGTGVADGLQRLADGDAVRVADAKRPVLLVLAAEDARRHHAGLEAAAFLVGPDDGLQGGRGLDAVVVEGPKNLQRRQHPEDAVEAPA